MKKDSISLIIIRKVFQLLHIKISAKTEHLFVQIFNFGIVGLIATIIDFGFLYLFKDICNLPLVLSNTLSFCISVIFNYFASMMFVFDVDENKSKKRNFILFVFLSVIGLIINDVIVYVVTEIVGIYYMLSKIFASVFVMVFNFVTRKKFLE